MKIITHPDALTEIGDVIEYYEQQQQGLGLKLKAEVEETVAWIQDNALTPRLRENGYRRVNLKTFSYYIAYIIRQDNLYILTIAHSHRQPEYWATRLSI
jgi:hypothetical protein